MEWQIIYGPKGHQGCLTNCVGDGVGDGDGDGVDGGFCSVSDLQTDDVEFP